MLGSAVWLMRVHEELRRVLVTARCLAITFQRSPLADSLCLLHPASAR